MNNNFQLLELARLKFLVKWWSYYIEKIFFCIDYWHKINSLSVYIPLYLALWVRSWTTIFVDEQTEKIDLKWRYSVFSDITYYVMYYVHIYFGWWEIRHTLQHSEGQSQHPNRMWQYVNKLGSRQSISALHATKCQCFDIKEVDT